MVEIDTLKWLAPMAIGAVALLITLAALYRGRNVGVWLFAAVLSAALVGGAVFGRVSISQEGLIIETVAAGAQSLVDLQTAVDANASAIEALSMQIASLAQASAESPGSTVSREALQRVITGINPIVNSLEVNRQTLEAITQTNAAIARNLEVLQSNR